MTLRAYLSAAEASRLLGISQPTLYAYVSRGQLRSEPMPDRPRARRYPREDIERLQQLKAARRDPQGAGARGLRWGGPVLESRITLIDGGRVYFRGRDAVALAEHATLEDAAHLLWEVPDAESPRLFQQPPALADAELARVRRLTRDPLAHMQAALAAAAARDAAALDLTPRAVRLTGARILRLLAAMVGRGSHAAPVHTALQRVWASGAPSIGEVIRTALVLCADHELNVSAFTARCVASAGASPYDVVSAALAALKGHRHGGASERALALVDRSDTLAAAKAELTARLRRGERIPGFGHPLYPDGDPRAALLLQLARASRDRAAWQSVRHAWKAGSALMQQEPNLDLGLAAITRAYGLPSHAPIVIFALGRTVGWIAHAIEEYASGQLIRPRARYVGPPPSR